MSIKIKPFTRYFGGKTNARDELASNLPSDITHIASPFIGGGSFELYCASELDIKVSAYDNFASLVRHWNIMLTRSGEVIRAANKIFPVKSEILTDLIISEKIHSTEPFPNGFPSPEKDIAFAAIIMCMIRQGFNGYYLRRRHFKDVDNPDLAKYKAWDEAYWDEWQVPNLTVECQEWETTLKKHHDTFLFCDPPYVGCDKYYGRYVTKETEYTLKPFQHEQFAEAFLKHEAGGILTYQDDDKGMIRSLYKDLEIIETSWHQGSKASQGKENPTELIIKRAPSEIIDNTEVNGIGDLSDIARVYGMYYDNNQHSDTLCKWIERQFACFNPLYPCRWELGILLRNVPYEKYGCTKDDVRGIIDALLVKGIIISDTNNYHNQPRLGYPKYEVENMDAHIKNMSEIGISIKAAQHFSYDYSGQPQEIIK